MLHIICNTCIRALPDMFALALRLCGPSDIVCLCISGNALIHVLQIYVTQHEKTGLMYTKYTSSYYGPYLFYCLRY